MTEDINANDVVAFFVEVAVLALLCVWGFRTGANLGTKLLLGLGVPAVAIGLWALFAAPNAVYDVAAAQVAVKVLVLGAGILAAFAVVPTAWAVAFSVVVVANTLLLYFGPFAR